MTETVDPQVTDAKIGQAAQIALMIARIEVPVIESLSEEAIKRFIKERLDMLRTLGGLTQEEAQALKAQVDGTAAEAAAHLSVFGPDGQPSLAGLISHQLRSSATESAAGHYVAAMAGLGAGLVGFAVCGLGCAFMSAAQAGALTASIKSS